MRNGTCLVFILMFFFSSRRRHTRYIGDWSSDVCSSDLSSPPRSPSRAPGHAHPWWRRSRRGRYRKRGTRAGGGLLNGEHRQEQIHSALKIAEGARVALPCTTPMTESESHRIPVVGDEPRLQAPVAYPPR